MKLWSVQSPEAWDVLCRTGELTCPMECIDDAYEAAYIWLLDQMERRLNVSRPPGCSMLWGWQRYDGKTDLTIDDVKYYSLPEGDQGYLLEVDVPDESVLLSDFQTWHCVLNGGYLSFTEAEDEDFDRRLAAAGFRFPSVLSVPPAFQTEIRESWNRIFDFTPSPGWLHGDNGVLDIQATFFRLKREQVRSAQFFVGLKAPDDPEDEDK